MGNEMVAKTKECGFCKTEVPEQASVCKNCGAMHGIFNGNYYLGRTEADVEVHRKKARAIAKRVLRAMMVLAFAALLVFIFGIQSFGFWTIFWIFEPTFLFIWVVIYFSSKNKFSEPVWKKKQI